MKMGGFFRMRRKWSIDKWHRDHQATPLISNTENDFLYGSIVAIIWAACLCEEGEKQNWKFQFFVVFEIINPSALIETLAKLFLHEIGTKFLW